MIRCVREVVKRAVLRLADRLPTAKLEGLIRALVARRADKLPADEALRFLFRLDAELYQLQGRKATDYGGGTHTKHRHLRYHDFFVDRIGAGDRVLDVGCGNGALACDVAERAGARMVAIDHSGANIAAAREKCAPSRATYQAAAALKEVPEGPFSAVILSNVLEHLTDRPAFLRQLAETTGAKRFLIRVPLFERDWRVPLKQELGVEWRLDPTHVTEHTLESFAEEMADAGLTVVHREVRWGEIWAEAVAGD